MEGGTGKDFGIALVCTYFLYKYTYVHTYTHTFECTIQRMEEVAGGPSGRKED